MSASATQGGHNNWSTLFTVRCPSCHPWNEVNSIELTPATVLRPWYRTNCISHHPQLRTGWFVGAKFQIRGKTLEFSMMVPALSLYHLKRTGKVTHWPGCFPGCDCSPKRTFRDNCSRSSYARRPSCQPTNSIEALNATQNTDPNKAQSPPSLILSLSMNQLLQIWTTPSLHKLHDISTWQQLTKSDKAVYEHRYDPATQLDMLGAEVEEW